MFSFVPQDAVSKIYPTRQYVKGNEIVKVFTSYFFDKAAPTAKCKFTFDPLGNAVEFTVRVIAFDSDGVMCYHPPAYLISPLLVEGGDTQLTVSSNGVDFSD